MQRLVSLLLLTALVGGGYTYLQGQAPDKARQAVEAVHNVAGQAFKNLATSVPQPAPATDSYGGPAPPPTFQAPRDPMQAPTVRIASFNIQTFGDKKASKPYVMEAIARVIRSFDVVAIQEIRTQDDYFIPKLLRDYVNTAGAQYDSRVSQRLGRTRSTEQYAFVFNTSTIEVHPRLCAVFPDTEDRLHREPYVAFFRTRIQPPHTPWTFMLINSHTDPDEIPEELDALYYVYREVQRTAVDGATEDDVILLGDLNTKVQAASRYRPDPRARSLRPSDLGLLARIPGVSPLIRNESTMVSSNRLYDNLIVPSYTTVEFTGRCGVMDLRAELGYQLTEQHAREISDHQPVWGEFSAIEGGGYRSAAR